MASAINAMKELSEHELRALVGLLDDEDPQSQELLRRQIIGAGRAVLPFLEEAQSRTDSRLRRRLVHMRRAVLDHELELEFGGLAADDPAGLEAGCLMVSRYAYPDLDARKYGDWFDETARAVGPPLEPGADPYPLAQRLCAHLFDELGFKGSRTRYYDPDNSCLNRVIDRREGIPVTLCALFLLLARRLRLPAAGAGLPGHFMVRLPLAGKAYFLDAYSGGQILTRTQCREFLLRSGQVYREEYLRPCGDRDILARVLRNLIAIHHNDGAPVQAEQLSRLLDILLRGAMPSR